MILPLFNLSWWDDSNGSKIIFLASIFTKLMHYKYLMIIDIRVWSSDCIRMILPLFDLSWWNDSNGSKSIFLVLILTKLIHFKHLIIINIEAWSSDYT
jgi:hypothetical protein